MIDIRKWKIGKYLFIDLINPVKWKQVILSKLVGAYAEELLTLHGVEQLMFRRGQCPQCIINGTCVGYGECNGCGCNTWEKMLIQETRCECGRWGEFKSKEDWDAYKVKFGIKFYYQINEITKEIV